MVDIVTLRLTYEDSQKAANLYEEISVTPTPNLGYTTANLVLDSIYEKYHGDRDIMKRYVVEFHIDYINDTFETASEAVSKRLKRSPNCPLEIKMFLKMKWGNI